MKQSYVKDKVQLDIHFRGINPNGVVQDKLYTLLHNT